MLARIAVLRHLDWDTQPAASRLALRARQVERDHGLNVNRPSTTMTHIVFYEKPGCANNARQKAWLAAVGHTIEARNLLTHPWTCDELLRFFGNRPVAEWFNRAAPRIKSCEVQPDTLDDADALTLLIRDPLLIRRPLIEADGQREIGFDLALVAQWLGLPASAMETSGNRNAENCAKDAHAAPCPNPQSPKL